MHASHRILIGLDALVAVTAFGGGAALILHPTGWAGLTLDNLAHSPFSSYLVPGMILFGVVGGTAAFAALSLLLRASVAPWAAGVASAALLGWISVEAALLRTFHLLQASYLAISALGLMLAWRELGARDQ